MTCPVVVVAQGQRWQPQAVYSSGTQVVAVVVAEQPLSYCPAAVVVAFAPSKPVVVLLLLVVVAVTTSDQQHSVAVAAVVA